MKRTSNQSIALSSICCVMIISFVLSGCSREVPKVEASVPNTDASTVVLATDMELSGEKTKDTNNRVFKFFKTFNESFSENCQKAQSLLDIERQKINKASNLQKTQMRRELTNALEILPFIDNLDNSNDAIITEATVTEKEEIILETKEKPLKTHKDLKINTLDIPIERSHSS